MERERERDLSVSLFNLCLSSEVIATVASILQVEVLSSGRQITHSRSYIHKTTEPAFQSSLLTLSPIFSSLTKVSIVSTFQKVNDRSKGGGSCIKKFSEGYVRNKQNRGWERKG